MGEVRVSNTVPFEAMKILMDALQEFRDIVDEGFELKDFNLVVGTHPDEQVNTDIKVTLGEQDFELAYE